MQVTAQLATVVPDAAAVADDQERFFASGFAPLCRTAYALLGDADVGEEVVMDAFASMLLRWDAVAAVDDRMAYARRAVTNLAISRVRRLVAERRARQRLEGRRDTRAPADASLGADSLALVAALQQLPPRQRACVVLRYVEDLPEAEVAGALGCSLGTVKSQLAKARRSLAAVLRIDEEA